MTDVPIVADQLRHYAVNIEKWRVDAAALRVRAAAASGATPASTEDLVALERTAGDIYSEIAAFKKTVAEIASSSPAAAGELAEVGESLHLLLLEITEIGTGMYETRSALPAEPETIA